MDRVLPRPLGLRWPVYLAGSLGVAVVLYLDVHTILALLKFAVIDGGAQADWRNLVAASELANPYEVGYRWSPVGAWMLKPVVAGGWWLFVAAHFAALALVRDWRVVLLMLAWWSFWNDVVHGNVLTFAFVIAWLALAGSRWATWAFYALTMLVPRPLMLPVAIWLLWKRPASRLPFAVIFVVHALLVLLTGLGDEWITRLLDTPAGEILHPANFGPTRILGSAWIPVGLALAAWLTWRGRLGLASIAIQPYLFPYYMMFVLLDLNRCPSQLVTPLPARASARSGSPRRPWPPGPARRRCR